MGFFKEPRVKQEATAFAGEQEPPKRLTPRQYKAQKKNDRKGNLNRYTSKKAEQSSRIDALVEQRSAHHQVNTIKSTTTTYSPKVEVTQSVQRAADFGLAAVAIATKQFFSKTFWK